MTLKPLPLLRPLELPTPILRPSAGVVIVNDSISMAPAGSAIRIDLYGAIFDDRASAYIDPATALRFATELARLARALSS